MRQDTQKRDAAVSPVVGVMLMLVVTIIIAAMVASFAGTISGNEKSAPQVTLSVDYTAKIVDTDKTNDKADNPASNNAITFRRISGQPFSLKDIAVQLQNGDKVLKFDMNTQLNTSASVKEENRILILNNSAGNKTYFAVPPGMSEVISAGDSFTLLADSSYDSTLAAPDSGIEKGRFLTWAPEGSAGIFKLQTNVPFEYTVLDTISGKPMQTGTITIR